MKLLVEAISAKRGGIVTYTKNLIAGLRNRGVEATFAVPLEFEDDSDGLIRCPASAYGPANRLLWEQIAWRRIIGKVRPDVLFSSANFGLFQSPVPQVLLVREGGLFDPFYLTNIAPAQGLSSAVIRQWRRRLILASASWANLIVTPTTVTRDQLVAWRPALAEKIEVCPYGTRTDVFTSSKHERAWRTDGHLRLIYVSVYYPHKNPGALFDAVRILNEGGISTKATVTMSADEIEHARGSALDMAQLKQSQRDGDIELGRRPYTELPDVYGSHDVFVFPSVSETFGHPMVEAMSMGLPVVAADTPVNREVCGDVALYFRPFSSAELAARIRELDTNPGLRQRLSASGRQRCELLFRWDDHVDRLVASCRRVAGSKASTVSG